MDLLSAYASDSDDDRLAVASAELAPVSSSRTRNIVSGSLHTVSLSNAAFNQLERQFCAHSLPQAAKPGISIPDKSITTAKPPTAASKPRPSPAKSPPAKRKRPASKPVVPTCKFHLRASDDYQNRAWTAPASSLRTFADLETYTPYIPTTSIWSSHAFSKGASCVRFSPPYGNLLLSCGLDGVVKVYLTESKQLAMTYLAHTAAVRHVDWKSDASSFLSAGYDRNVFAWDTETGKVFSAFRTDGFANCARWADQNQLLVACSDKKVLQLDLRDANSVVQVYDQHMGAVNDLVFVDNGSRFVTSCDDKVLRVWEYGVPVVIKYISDPSAHAMPSLTLHPNTKWLLGQSMDNTIKVFSTDKFRRRDKMFKGHLVGGYACGLTTSPDGRFLASGDSTGKLYFWDWKTSRVFRSLRAHKGVCIDVDWHPTQPSLVASAGWDGNIALWD